MNLLVAGLCAGIILGYFAAQVLAWFQIRYRLQAPIVWRFKQPKMKPPVPPDRKGIVYGRGKPPTNPPPGVESQK